MKCELDKTLIPLKLVLFTYYGAAACLLPYLTVHMRQIGITVEETAIIYAVLPIVGFLGPPTAGFFADRLGRYQPVLIAALIGVGVFHTALLAIPQVSIEEIPINVEFLCSHQGTSVKADRCSPKKVCPNNLTSPEMNLGLGQCFTSCLASKSHLNQSLISEICLQGNSLTCDHFDQSNISITVSDIVLVSSSSSGCEYQIQNFNWNNKTFTNMTCPLYNVDCHMKCSLHFTLASLAFMPAFPPASSVILPKAENELGEFPMCEKYIGNHMLTFSTYFLLRIIGGVFLSTAFTLMDATCFAMIKTNNGEYGKQKLWSILATAIFSPITGILIDHMTKTKGFADYSPAFYVFDGLIICTIMLSFRLKMQLDNPSDKMLKNLKRLLQKFEVVAFLVMIFVLGTMWGFLETFLFWYMLDLNSPKYLLGLTVTIGSGVSIPVLFCAGKIVKKLGNITLLILAFIIYSLRMIGYSLIHNPWWSLVFESMEVITINLMWVAAATYGNDIAPKGLTATMQGTMGGIHYGIGRGAGSFAGGLLMQHFGARKTFRIMGITSATAGIIAFIYYMAYFRRSSQDRPYRKGSVSNGIKNRDDSQLQQILKKETVNETESCI